MNWLAAQTMRTRLIVIVAAALLVGAVIATVLPGQRRFLLDLGLGLTIGGALAGVLYGLVRRYARRRSGAPAVSVGSPEMTGLWAALLQLGLGASLAAQLVGSTNGSLVLSGAGIAVLLVSVAGNAVVVAARGQVNGKAEA
ncbi:MULTISPECIES: hypothetical protein [unclassified Actinomyces]|uniref:hypothetical protein n=1 Tax=unclassified Actinomyces TaxID=2609248 RepID=UPI0013A70C9D|nr:MULTISPECIES: hypothetical protein [unclassified Actinomyces]MBW3068307.1 hypothetical protein [Actinomyces sp. 594]NDR53681.1 hypothetical protein [Actinomyces sp. 565]